MQIKRLGINAHLLYFDVVNNSGCGECFATVAYYCWMCLREYFYEVKWFLSKNYLFLFKF